MIQAILRELLFWIEDTMAVCCFSKCPTCSPDMTFSLTNIPGWQHDMSYAPIRMIQIQSEDGKERVRRERKGITVGGQRKEGDNNNTSSPPAPHKSLSARAVLSLMPQATLNSLLSSPSHPSPLARFPRVLLSALNFVFLAVHLLLFLSFVTEQVTCDTVKSCCEIFLALSNVLFLILKTNAVDDGFL